MSDDDRNRSNIPIPDPSLITVDRLTALEIQMRREYLSMRELLEHQIEAQTKIGAERLLAINIQFVNLTDKLNTSISSTSDALKIALSAQRDAANESKVTFTRQIDSVQTSIIELKELIYRGEGKDKGTSDSAAKTMAIIALVSAIIFGTSGIIISLLMHH